MSVKEKPDEQTASGDNLAPQVETLPDGELMKIIGILNSFRSEVNEDSYKRLLKLESQCDSELSKLYHEIEVSHANAYEGWQYYCKLRKILIRRRDIKDTLAVYIKLKNGTVPIYDTISGIISYLKNRKWSRRDLK